MQNLKSSNVRSGQSPGWQAPEHLLQADTVSRTAANTLTGGWADNFEAGMDALYDHKPGTWLDRYKAELNDEVQRNLYDASHRKVAVALGNALGYGLMAAGAFEGGARGSAALPIRMKGQLGEGLSAAKTVLQGDRPVGFQVRTALDNGKKTVLDHATAKGLMVEAKFGPAAKLSTNQKYAQQQFGPLYRVDHWLPEHVGAITAPLGPAVGGLLSWGMHQLNPSQGDTPSSAAPMDDATSNATPPDDAAPDDVDGGSQYGRWQDDFGYPATN